MNNPRLQIVRGLPGSSKSTYAHKNWPQLLKLEFDYFCMRGGAYSWGKQRNADGQKWLRQQIVDACMNGIDFVVCGVFAGPHENFELIVKLAEAYGYDVWVKTLAGNFGNIHGVRQQDYDAMRSAFKSDEELCAGLLDVRIGDMPRAYNIEPMPDGL